MLRTVTLIAVWIAMALGGRVVSQAQDWTPVGGIEGGAVHALAMDEQGAVYGTVAGRLFRQETASADVELLLVDTSVWAVAVHGDTLWAGTDQGVRRSVDRGITWHDAGLVAQRIRALTIGEAGLFAADVNGVFQSTDGGTTWTSATAGLWQIDSFPIQRLLTLSRGTVLLTRGPGPLGGGGIFQWVGGGWVAWELSAVGAAGAEAPDGTLYAATTERSIYDTGGGLYRSHNNGVTWRVVPFFERGRGVFDVTVDAEGTVYAADGMSIYRSTDGGESWSDLGFPPWPPTRVLIGADGSVVAGTGTVCAVAVDWVPGGCIPASGVFRYRNGTWHRVEVVDNLGQVRALARGQEGALFAAGFEGLFASSDRGVTWKRVLPYRREDQVVYDELQSIHEAPDGTVFVLGRGLYRVAGDTALVSLEDTTAQRVQGLVIHPDGSLIARIPNRVRAPGGIFWSTDSGATWTVSSIIDRDVSALAIDALGTLWAGIKQEGIWRSEDAGRTWVRAGLEGQTIHLLRTSDTSQVIEYASQASGERSLFRYDRAAATWRQIPLSGRPVQDLVVTEKGKLFILNYEGILYTADDGTTWIKTDTFETNEAQVVMRGTDDYLYVGTDGQGVYRSIAPAASVAREVFSRSPSEDMLGASYPNPGADRVTISMHLERPSPVVLSVFDVLGRQVATVVDVAILPVGTHQVTWSTEHLPSGTYFYRLQAAGQTQVRTLTLLK